MTSHEVSTTSSRRRFLTAAAAGGTAVWAAPAVLGTMVAQADGSETTLESGATGCLLRTFTRRPDGSPLVYGPNDVDRFIVSFGTAFTAITKLTVTLHQDPSDPIGSDPVCVYFEDVTPTISACAGTNDPKPNPYVVDRLDQASLLLDGTSKLVLGAAGASSDFTLTRIVVELCGTAA